MSKYPFSKTSSASDMIPQTADSTDEDEPAFVKVFLVVGTAEADLAGCTTELGGSSFFSSFFKLFTAWDNLELLQDFIQSPTSCSMYKIRTDIFVSS